MKISVSNILITTTDFLIIPFIQLHQIITASYGSEHETDYAGSTATPSRHSHIVNQTPTLYVMISLMAYIMIRKVISFGFRQIRESAVTTIA